MKKNKSLLVIIGAVLAITPPILFDHNSPTAVRIACVFIATIGCTFFLRGVDEFTKNKRF